MTTQDPFASMPRELTPPPALRARVVHALRDRGLLTRAQPMARLGRAAAAVLLVAIGAYAGRLTNPANGEPVSDTREQFALMLYEPAGFDRSRTHEELATEYGAWAGSLGADFVGGEALGDARVLGGEAPTDEPTGFFLVRATSYDAAVTLARGCPHLKYGGVVSVRTVPPT